MIQNGPSTFFWFDLMISQTHAVTIEFRPTKSKFVTKPTHGPTKPEGPRPAANPSCGINCGVWTKWCEIINSIFSIYGFFCFKGIHAMIQVMHTGIEVVIGVQNRVEHRGK